MAKKEGVHPHKRFHGEDWHTPQGRLIREVVFGINDGLVSTVCFMAGVYGSLADIRLIAVAGMAEMIAGAFSMGMSSYISTKSQSEYFLSEIERERREIDEFPDKEREELGISRGEIQDPIKNGLIMCGSFILGAIPARGAVLDV